VDEFLGYGCSDDKFIANFGNMVYWYSINENNFFVYDGKNVKNLSEKRQEFSDVEYVYVNNRERQVVIVCSGKQVLYHIEYDLFTQSTEMGTISETDYKNGQSLFINSNNELKLYPGEGNTTEQTQITTKSYEIRKNYLRRVKPRFDGDSVNMQTNIEYASGNPGYNIQPSVTSMSVYGIGKKCDYFNITLTGLTKFIGIDVEVREL